MRKLATVRRIDDMLPIEGADAIVLVKLDGWQCIAKVGEFTGPGDLCIYFEIDSHLPLSPQYEHIRARAFKRMGEREGLRIKTIKLRGQLSQGLALPLSMFPDLQEEWSHTFNLEFDGDRTLKHGDDVSELLDVQKYEPPVPAELSGKVRGNFPGDIPKTDQERCQNIGQIIFAENAESRYEASMKMDGTSFTGYVKNGRAGVCGRNWDLDMNEENEGNSLIRMFIDSGLRDALLSLDRDVAVQGELMGPAIQRNREKFLTHRLYVFDIVNITTGEYLPPGQRLQVLNELWARGVDSSMVYHAPILHNNVTLAELGVTNTTGLLLFVEGPSVAHPIREGVVFKRMDGKFSFKAISNKFLLKEED